jgi:hypothetical protein
MIGWLSWVAGLSAYGIVLIPALLQRGAKPTQILVRLVALALPVLPFGILYYLYPSGSCPEPSCAHEDVLVRAWPFAAILLVCHLWFLTRSAED